MSEICRICLEQTEAENLISPCECKGTQKYVHRKCLLNWQETAMDSFLTRPSQPRFVNFNVCGTCKTPYKLSTSVARRIYLSPHVEYLYDKYKYQIYLSSFLYIFAHFFFPFWLPTVVLLLIIAYLCFKNNMRPFICSNSKGYRLTLIMIGKPVAGLSQGIILEASNRIPKGIFAGSKIIITEYSVQRAIGFIINKGICNFYLAMGAKTIKFGGPVKISTKHLLHTDAQAEGSTFVSEGIYYGGRANLNDKGVRVLEVNGHAEWKSLQLDGEVSNGSWTIGRIATVEDVFKD